MDQGTETLLVHTFVFSCVASITITGMVLTRLAKLKEGK